MWEGDAGTVFPDMTGSEAPDCSDFAPGCDKLDKGRMEWSGERRANTLVFWTKRKLPAVILGLGPRIQPSQNAGASGWMDGRAKPDHDKLGSR